ncbi:MAG: virulence RhuM family protein [Lactobacillales bacterium]|jgi:hypothetical protein|nr:virulence RhuM family protein [Lactobacillales bacterium]
MNNELEFLLYDGSKDDANIEVIVKDETIWATQKTIGELFGVGKSAISKHLKNIFAEDELDEEVTVSKMETVINRGVRGAVKEEIRYYNIDAIISIGYRVNSRKATKFRQWATKILKEYTIKGFVLDDERLKQGEQTFGKDYFREMLERVRSIRASERRVWQQITDIFAELSIDYDAKSEVTKKFFATVQNKFHFAITGKTAAEIIDSSADSNLDNMGLVNWKNSPDGRILKTDSQIAKNYLNEKDIKRLERNVSAYFDYIENLIEEERIFTMEEFAQSLDEFLKFNRFEILDGAGKISMKDAKDKAAKEYDVFNRTQAINSDFDKLIKELEDK